MKISIVNHLVNLSVDKKEALLLIAELAELVQRYDQDFSKHNTPSHGPTKNCFVENFNYKEHKKIKTGNFNVSVRSEKDTNQN